MTDNEIIKALDCCSTDVRENTCPKCAFYKKHRCSTLMLNAVSDLINRQKAEIIRLKGSVITNNIMEIARIKKQAKSKAIKEFAERVKKSILPLLTATTLEEKDMVYRCLSIIDNLVKEMTEGK